MTSIGKPRPKRQIGAALALLLAATALPAAAPAQDLPGGGLPAAPAGQPPYEIQILRLSEILGAIQAIDSLCGSEETPPWRGEMMALIQAETKTSDRRARFVDHFNRGFKSFSEVHRTCSDSARTIRGRYLREGAELARELVSRYGNR